jgi:imidazolonepropionase-like amidohydrolase
MQLDGITVWNGSEEIGASTVSWNEAELTAVTPTAVNRWPDLAVIPGLIDTHVHITGPARAGDYTYGIWPLITTPAEQALHCAAQARQALESGVTTLRDMASDERSVAVRRCIDKGLIAGPRVRAFGVVNMTAGHQDLFTPADVPIRPVTADGPDNCRALVRRYARSGMDGIKVMAGGGVLSSGDRAEWRNYTSAELDAIVDEAHALGLPVAAHAHTERAIAAALAAGVDSIEHGTLLTDEQAGQIIERGVTVAPTLVINDGIADGSIAASAESRDKARGLLVERDQKMRIAADLGVSFILGTDTNGTMLHWGAAWREMQAMVRVLGYAPERALASATSLPASRLGLGARVGTIAAGWASDLLVVRGRPWAEVQAMSAENIVAVVCRGEVLHGQLPGRCGTPNLAR